MVKRIRILLYFLFCLFALLGFISTILLLLGYKPIIEHDIKLDWNAVSSIATILAVITALFITKYQNYLENKKSLSIWWLHTELRGDNYLAYPDFSNTHRLDLICIKFVNSGNRKIIISVIKLILSNKSYNILSPEKINTNSFLPQLTVPYILEPEDVCNFFIPLITWIAIIKTFIKDNKVTENRDIILVIEDTTGKEYIFNTKLKYSHYLEYYKLVNNNQ